MQAWKLSIKPESKVGFHPFDVCQKKGLIGIGWHHAFRDKKHPDTDEEAERLVTQHWAKYPHEVRHFAKDLKEGHLVWIHQKGHYFLCRVVDNNLIYGKDIDENYFNLDLGHARKALWVQVNDIFVSGSIQRGTIAPIAFQPINLSSQELKYCEYIIVRLSVDPNWMPSINIDAIATAVERTSMEDLFAVLTSEDFEDIIAFMFQERGWRLIKSTCSRSRSAFEFSMLDNNGTYGNIQVKAGRHPDQLPPSQYNDFTSKGSFVYLLFTNNNPYPGEQYNRVIPIQHSEVFHWIKANIKHLTLPIKTKLMIWAESE